jgi:hypothetical protein
MRLHGQSRVCDPGCFPLTRRDEAQRLRVERLTIVEIFAAAQEDATIGQQGRRVLLRKYDFRRVYLKKNWLVYAIFTEPILAV